MRESQDTRLIHQISTCPAPPGMTVLYVELTLPDERFFHVLLPVVMIRTTVTNVYHAPYREDRTIAPNHREMLKCGWTFAYQEEISEPVVIDDDFPHSLISLSELTALRDTVDVRSLATIPDRATLSRFINELGSGLRRSHEINLRRSPCVAAGNGNGHRKGERCASGMSSSV